MAPPSASDAETPRARQRTLIAFAVGLALAGAGLAVELLQEHLTVAMGNHAEGLLCSGAGRFDCNPVAAHPASWALGMPVAFWGLAFYVAMAGLGLLALRLPDRERAALVVVGAGLAAAALVVDVALAAVMVTQIGAICLTCVTTYLVTAVLAGIYGTLFVPLRRSASFGALGRGWRPRRLAESPGMIGVPDKLLIGLVVALGAGAAIGWAAVAVAEVRTLAREEVSEFLASLERPPAIDMRRFEGLPARGPAGAPLTIVVAADFKCSWCRGLANNLAALSREHPGRIRELYLHSPLADSCGPPDRGAIDEDPCWLAEVAACAAEQGKFWEVHDLLFAGIPFASVEPSAVRRRLAGAGLDTARVAACLRAGSGRAEVVRQVALRDTLRLDGTPSFVIRGHVREGGISPSSLRAIVRGLLAER